MFPKKRKARSDAQDWRRVGVATQQVHNIEDEMLALAKAYGYQVDDAVRTSVELRKNQHKKKRAAVVQKQLLAKNQDPKAANDESLKLLGMKDDEWVQRFLDVQAQRGCKKTGVHLRLMETLLKPAFELAKCMVPGCKCLKCFNFETMESEEGLEGIVCVHCSHGVLQHTLQEPLHGKENFSMSDEQAVLLRTFRFVRIGRIASSCVYAPSWLDWSIQGLSTLIKDMKAFITKGGGGEGTGHPSTMSSTSLSAASSFASSFASAGSFSSKQSFLGHRSRHAWLWGVLVKIQNLIPTVIMHSQATTSSQQEMAPRLAICFDKMFFELYYVSIVEYGRHSELLPTPVEYLSCIEECAANRSSSLEVYINNEVRGQPTMIHWLSTTLQFISEADPRSTKRIGSTKNGSLHLPKQGNDLLRLMQLRFLESIRLFYDTGIGMNAEMSTALKEKRLSSSSSTLPSNETFSLNTTTNTTTTTTTTTTTMSNLEWSEEEALCYPLLQQWRDICRDWSCHLFAYATPNMAALKRLAALQPLVEIGAGTGYWASLLQRNFNVDITCFDVAPPSSSYTCSSLPTQGDVDKKKKMKIEAKGPAQAFNDYHGQAPSFCNIHCGGPEVLMTLPANRNLFLCYPPPQNSMARDCLKHFQGEYVVYVGEWMGFTADRRFEFELLNQFTLNDRVVLPNWGNTAYEMTVWKRRQSGVQQESNPVGSSLNNNSNDSSPSIQFSSPFKCSNCAAVDDETYAQSRLNDSNVDHSFILRRCRICKVCMYCSEKCATEHQGQHNIEHVQRFIFLESEDDPRNVDTRLDFHNWMHYEPLTQSSHFASDYQSFTPWQKLISSTSMVSTRNETTSTTPQAKAKAKATDAAIQPSSSLCSSKQQIFNFFSQ